MNLPYVRRTDGGEIRNYLFGVLSLTSTRLTGNQHRLIDVVGQHIDVGTVRNSENMWWHFITTLTTMNMRIFLDCCEDLIFHNTAGMGFLLWNCKIPEYVELFTNWLSYQLAFRALSRLLFKGLRALNRFV
uniref:Uncharacterized protein n=1 Tax=Glossina palpalis gambiensis TaxID=67801 RepID=A0A1B0C7E8_9MUSC